MSQDQAGVDLLDLSAARDAAIDAARNVMMAEVSQGRLCLGCAIAIRGDDGETLLAVPFADAIEVTFAKSC